MYWLIHLVRPAAAVALIVSFWLTLYAIWPAVPATIHNLLAEHFVLVGVWLALAVVGADFAATSARNSIGFRDVGSKARQHFRLGGR